MNSQDQDMLQTSTTSEHVLTCEEIKAEADRLLSQTLEEGEIVWLHDEPQVNIPLRTTTVPLPLRTSTPAVSASQVTRSTAPSAPGSTDQVAILSVATDGGTVPSSVILMPVTDTETSPGTTEPRAANTLLTRANLGPATTIQQGRGAYHRMNGCARFQRGRGTRGPGRWPRGRGRGSAHLHSNQDNGRRCRAHHRQNCRRCGYIPLHIRATQVLNEIAERIAEYDGRRPTINQVRNLLSNASF